MNKTLIFAVLVIIGLSGGGYYLFQKEIAPVTESVTPLPSAEVDQFIQSTPDLTLLKAGGSSYSDPQGVFVFLYPNDYVIDHQGGDQYTRIFKKGATQKGQTEMYDGVIVSFERIDLGEKTLQGWVDDQVQQSTMSGLEITQPKRAVVLNSYPGFTYAVRGLGESKNLVVQKNPTSHFAVGINFLVADPEGIGYQTEVDAILSTFEMMK